MGVEEQPESPRPQRTVPCCRVSQAPSIEVHAESTHPAAVLPVLRHHPLAVGSEPHDILIGVLRFGITVVEGVPMKIRMLLAILDHSPREFQEFQCAARPNPSDTRKVPSPDNRRCCCLAESGSTRSPPENHGWNLEQHQGNTRNCAFAVRAVRLIPASSVGPSAPQFHELLSSLPSAAVFAVGFVVLLLVAHEILQRESVMRRDEN